MVRQNHRRCRAAGICLCMILSGRDSVGFCPQIQTLRSLRTIPTTAVQSGKAGTKDRIMVRQNHRRCRAARISLCMILSGHDSVGFCPQTQNPRSLRTIPIIEVQKGGAGAGCEWFRAPAAGTPPHGQAGSPPPQRLEMQHNHFHLRKNNRVTAAARTREKGAGSGTGMGPPESPAYGLCVAAPKLVRRRL